jgi:hypothetical protein
MLIRLSFDYLSPRVGKKSSLQALFGSHIHTRFLYFRPFKASLATTKKKCNSLLRSGRTFAAVRSYAGVPLFALLFSMKRIILPDHLRREAFLVLSGLVDS